MRIDLSESFIAHLAEQGLNVTSPVEIDDDSYAQVWQQLRSHPVHASEPDDQLRERVVYHILWQDKGVPEKTSDPEVGSGVMAARRSVSILEEMRKQNQEIIPDLGKRMADCIKGHSDLERDSLEKIQKAINAASENVVGWLHKMQEYQEHAQDAADTMRVAQLISAQDEASKTRKAIYGIGGAIILLLALLCLLSHPAHAQIDLIKLQNQGSTVKTVAAPFAINCSTNMTCSWSSGTFIITATSGGGGTTINVNGVAASTQNPINFQSGTNITVSNPSAGNIKFDLSGTINAATASSLAANPTDCSAGQYATTIDASGNLTCAQVAYSQISSPPTIPTDVSGKKYIIQTADAALPNAQALGALGTGIVKNTTTTGVLSIAVAADFPTLNQNTTGTAAGLTAAYIDWNAVSGGAFIQNKPTTFAPSAHNLLSTAHGDTTAASAVRGDGLFAVGATPTWQRVARPTVTGGYFKWNGTDIVASTLAASGTGSPTGCTNQVVTAFTLNADAAPTSTCTTITSAYTSGTFSPSSHDIISGHSASGLTTGTVLRATGATTFGFGTLDLANSSAVTGSLPWANQAHTAANVVGLFTGTPDGTKFLRDDGTLQTVSGGSGYATVQDEGVALTQRATINFTGSGVTCADNAGSTRTDCTINAGAATAGGSDTQIQYNSSSALAGDADFVWDATNNFLKIGQPTITTQAPLSIKGSVNGYLQANIQNASNGASASSDYVATADTGTDTTNYINMGINSSAYSDASYTSSGALDGYLYTNGGNLVLGTQSSSKVIKFHTGGTLSANIRAQISDSAVSTSYSGAGKVTLNGSSSGSASLQAGSAVTTYTWTLPTADSAGVLQSDGAGTISISAVKNYFQFATTTAPACTTGGGTTTFVGMNNSSTTETSVVRIIVPVAGTLKYLGAKIIANVPASETAAIKVSKNASTTGTPNCSIAAANSSCTDTSTSVAVSAGDLLSISVNCSGGTSALGAGVGIVLGIL